MHFVQEFTRPILLRIFLDSLRCVVAFASLWDLWLITSDVSTALMYAEVEEDACDLVLLPSNISFKGERVV